MYRRNAQGMPQAGRPLCEAVQQMVMGAMQIEAIRRRKEVITLHLPACSQTERHGMLSIAVPVPWCALLRPTPGQPRPAQGRGAPAPVPETSTAAAADANGANSRPANSRAAADSPAASQSVIPLTVAQRAKAAAAALGAFCV